MSPPIWLSGPMFLLANLCERDSPFEDVYVKAVSVKSGSHDRGSP